MRLCRCVSFVPEIGLLSVATDTQMHGATNSKWLLAILAAIRRPFGTRQPD